MAEAFIFICIAAYLAGGFALLGWMAWCNNPEARVYLVMMLAWPLVIGLLAPALALLDWLHKRGWYVDIKRQPERSPFGFRRRTSGFGWALRCLWIELQVWRDLDAAQP